MWSKCIMLASLCGLVFCVPARRQPGLRIDETAPLDALGHGQRLLPGRKQNSTSHVPPKPPAPGSPLYHDLLEKDPQNQNNSLSVEINRPYLTAQHRSGSGGQQQQNPMTAMLPYLLSQMNGGGGGGGGGGGAGRAAGGGGGGDNNAALMAMMMAMSQNQGGGGSG